MARILIIEDEKDIQEVLAYNLRQDGHTTVSALRGREGLRLVREQKPDLVILDLMLPDLSGSEVCRSLRQDPSTQTLPVIMLTAKGEEIDRVVGFELGADDYVVKPFSVRELLLRIRALLRRSETRDAASASSASSGILFGHLKLDSLAHRVWVREEEIRLTALEFKLLITLYTRRNRVQTRDTLLDAVWGIDAEVTTRTVDTHVKRLREKLGPAGSYIETVRGVGYRFLPESEET